MISKNENYIDQLGLDPRRKNAVRKLVKGAGGVNDSTPLVEELNGDELIPVKQGEDNKAVSVEQIAQTVKNNSKIKGIVPKGVAILDGSGNILTNAADWREELGITGLTVSDGEHKIVVFIEHVNDDDYWYGYYNYENNNLDIEELDNKNEDTIDLDFNTVENTEILLKYSNYKWDIANIAKTKIESGIYKKGEWFVPAGGHLKLITDNINAIKEILNSIGYSDYKNAFRRMWSSSEHNYHSGYARLYSTSDNYYYWFYANKHVSYVLVPIHVVTPDEEGSITDNLKELQSKVDSLETITINLKELQSKVDSLETITIDLSENSITEEVYNKAITAIEKGTPINVIVNNEAGNNYVGIKQADATIDPGNNIQLQYTTITDTGNCELVSAIILSSNFQVITKSINVDDLSPYIWDGTTSETIFNELKEAINNNRIITDGYGGIYYNWSYTSDTIYLAISHLELATKFDGLHIYTITASNVDIEIVGLNAPYASTHLMHKCYNNLGTLTTDTTITSSKTDSVYEYQGEFSFGDTVYNVTFPDSITWITKPTSFKANTTYQFEIINDIGKLWEVGGTLGTIGMPINTTAELVPGGYMNLGEIAADITIAYDDTPLVENMAYTYQGQFSFGDTVYTITWPSDIIWASNSQPSFAANYTYQFSIVNGFGVMGAFANS